MNLDSLTKEELISLLKEVVMEAVEARPLSDDEVKWVRLAIEAEANRAAFRKAVIEKTFIGLMSTALLGAIMYGFEFFKDHWK